MIARLFLALFALLLAVFIWLAWPSDRDAPVLRLGSTTSTRDSGLLDHLLPLYQGETGVEVVVFAKGTGAAIRDGLEGRVDALFVHNREREEALVTDSYAVERLAIMHNNFLFVGPKDMLGYKEASRLIHAIAQGEKGLFLSRGDGSGTHAAEVRIWAARGLNPTTFGDWYVETGTGMGQTLISANTNGAITLVDGATWARHGDREALHIIHDGRTGESVEYLPMKNEYGYLALNPEVIGGVNHKLAADFGAWLAGPTGQAAIAAYTIGDEQVFFPHTQP